MRDTRDAPNVEPNVQEQWLQVWTARLASNPSTLRVLYRPVILRSPDPVQPAVAMPSFVGPRQLGRKGLHPCGLHIPANVPSPCRSSASWRWSERSRTSSGCAWSSGGASSTTRSAALRAAHAVPHSGSPPLAAWGSLPARCSCMQGARPLRSQPHLKPPSEALIETERYSWSDHCPMSPGFFSVPMSAFPPGPSCRPPGSLGRSWKAAQRARTR